jgi:hypothetical protein
MEPALFVMAILGCGEGDLPCAEVRVAETRYESRAACLEASEAELARAGDVLYPVVVADCRAAGERPRLLQARDVALPEPEPNRHYPPVRQASAPRR